MPGIRIDAFDPLPTEMLPSDHLAVGRGDDGYRLAKSGLLEKSKRITTVAPAIADFPTWVNQNSAVAADIDDGFRLSHAGIATGINISSRVRAVPAGVTWTIIMGFTRGYQIYRDYMAGMVLRDTNGRMLLFTAETSADIQTYGIRTATSNTAINSNYAGNGPLSPVSWFKCRRNNTVFQFFFSYDGLTWYNFTADRGTGDHFTGTAAEWGAFINLNATGAGHVAPGSIDIFHWQEAASLL